MTNIVLRAKYEGRSRRSSLFQPNCTKEQLLTASTHEQAPDTRSSQLGFACTSLHAAGRARRYDISGDGDRTLISLNKLPELERESQSQKRKAATAEHAACGRMKENERRSTASCADARMTLQKMHARSFSPHNTALKAAR